MEMCIECKHGASGQNGHRHLKERYRASTQDLTLPQFVTFECTSCGLFWRRLGPPGRCAWSAERK
ncbi:MAG: hypothetical protein ACXWG1_12970 [Usitatibacter sp.]